MDDGRIELPATGLNRSARWLEAQRDTLRPGRRVLLRGGDGQPLPETFDGEGLVIEGGAGLDCQ